MNLKTPGTISGALYRLGEKIQFVSSKDPDDMYKAEYDEAHMHDNPQRFLKIKNLFAKSFEQSIFLNLYRSFISFIFSSKLRSYGYFFFACGLTNVFSYFLKRFVSFLYGDAHNLMFGIALILISVIALLERASLGDAICNSNFYISLFYPVTGIRKWEIKSSEYKKEHPFIMIISGIVIGIIGVIFSPYKLIAMMLFIIASLIILYKPESGLTLSILLMFFISEKLLWYFSSLTLLSLFFKTVIGKRKVHFSRTDIAVLITSAVFTVLSISHIESGSAVNAYRLLVMISFYFSGKMLIKTADTYKRVLFSLNLSLLIGSLIICAYGILALFGIDIDAELAEIGLESIIDISKQSGILIAMMCPVTAGFMAITAKPGEKLLCIFALISSLCALFFVESGGVWVAFFCGMILYILISYKSALYFVAVACLAGISAFSFIPQKALDAIFIKTGISNWNLSNTAKVWQSGFDKMIKSMPWGLGLGKNASAEALKTGSLYLEMGVIFGIFGIIASILFIAILIMKCIKYSKKTINKELHYSVSAVLCGAIPLILIGITGAVSDYKIFATFFLYLAMPAAARGVSERERERPVY